MLISLGGGTFSKKEQAHEEQYFKRKASYSIISISSII